MNSDSFILVLDLDKSTKKDLHTKIMNSCKQEIVMAPLDATPVKIAITKWDDARGNK